MICSPRKNPRSDNDDADDNQGRGRRSNEGIDLLVSSILMVENQMKIQNKNKMRRYHHHHPIKTATSRILTTFFTSFASRQISSSSSSSSSIIQRIVAEAFTTATTAASAFHASRHPTIRGLFPFVNHNNNPGFQNVHSATSNTRRTMTTTTTTTTTSATNTSNNQQQHQKDIMDMQNALYRIRAVNNMPIEIRQSLLEFRINDGVVLGKVQPAVAEMLVQTNSTVFQLIKDHDSSSSKNNFLTLTSALATSSCDERSAAIHSVMVQLRNQGLIKGWRDEKYPVMASSFYDDPVFVMERAAVNYLGVVEYGVHINGIITVAAADAANSSSSNSIIIPDEQRMWIARRSATKSKFPGMLDHIVAGGQSVGISLMDNCIKECAEEAGIPEHLTRAGLRPAGAISYETYSASLDTITRAVLFCFDLYLPSDFQPQAVDGEVQEFMTWTVPQLLASLAPDFHDPVKPNCYPVMIDWLLRQGHLSPDVPGYLDVLRELRSGDCQ